jgi:hypothetical protein
MPVYEAECGKCGRQADYFASIEERNALVPDCCGQRMQRIITGACLGYVQRDIAYESPTTGRVITSHRARLDDLKRSRARPWEGLEQEKKEAARKRGYIEQKQDAKLEEAARRAWHQMPPAKRAVLDGSE